MWRASAARARRLQGPARRTLAWRKSFTGTRTATPTRASLRWPGADQPWLTARALVTTIGTLGARLAGLASALGRSRSPDGSPSLDWWVAADDRWHTPAPSRASASAWCGARRSSRPSSVCPAVTPSTASTAVADGGGLVVIEVENASSLPFAVAFAIGALLSARPPTSVPAPGIDLPAVGRVSRSGTARWCGSAGARGRPSRVSCRAACPGPSRWHRAGWPRPGGATGSTGSTTSWLEGLAGRPLPAAARRPRRSARSGPLLLAVAELVPLGEPIDPDLAVVVADAAEGLARASRARTGVAWDVRAALEEAAVVLRLAGDARAAGDAMAMAGRLTPSDAAAGRTAARCRSTGGLDVAPPAHTDRGRGRPVPRAARRPGAGATWPSTGRRSARGEVSCALRWHGPRAGAAVGVPAGPAAPGARARPPVVDQRRGEVRPCSAESRRWPRSTSARSTSLASPSGRS